ncbi:MAG: transposase [Candidatus Roizmanbacteria bacterium]
MIYRQRKPNRLKNFNYSSNGYYFVTICAKNRECLFGEIIDGKMVLNEHGKIIEKYWEEIPNHYQNILLDEFIIMPNHIHGIVVISKHKQKIIKNVGTEQCSVPTRFGLLSKIIKSFKEIIIKIFHIEFGNYRFKWQRSFYDHIIRNEESVQKIREYIRNNAKNWNKDRNNPKNVILKRQGLF